MNVAEIDVWCTGDWLPESLNVHLVNVRIVLRLSHQMVDYFIVALKK